MSEAKTASQALCQELGIEPKMVMVPLTSDGLHALYPAIDWTLAGQIIDAMHKRGWSVILTSQQHPTRTKTAFKYAKFYQMGTSAARWRESMPLAVHDAAIKALGIAYGGIG